MNDFEQWLESQDEEESAMFSSQWRIGWNAAIASMQSDAAAEIARLTKESEEARKALQGAKAYFDSDGDISADSERSIIAAIDAAISKIGGGE